MTNTVLQKIHGLCNRLRHEGLVATLHYVIDSCRPGEQRILRLDGEPAPASPAPRDGLAVGGIEELRRLRQHGLPAAFFRDEIAGCNRCCVALSGGELAGVVWVFDERFPSLFVDLAPGDAELGAAFVLPRFRGRGLFIFLLRAACSALAAEGYRTFYAVVDERNIPSLRAFDACGFRYVGGLSRPMANLFARKYRGPGSPFSRATERTAR